MLVVAAGFLVTDIITAGLPKIAEPGELVYTTREITVSIGGHPANLSANLVKLGVPPSEICVIGAVGKDVFGDFIVRELGERGLVTVIQRVEEKGTTKDVILVVKGEDRRFHVDIGASLMLDPELVKEKIAEYRPLIAYLAAGLNGRFDDVLIDVVREAKRFGSKVFLDLARPYGRDWNFILPALKEADMFHCNDAELRYITGIGSTVDAARWLTREGLELLLVTMGSRGAYAFTSRIVVKEKAFKVDAVDPTGAGDAFSAGIISWLTSRYGEELRGVSLDGLSGDELKEMLLYGQAVAAVKCMGVGAGTVVNRRSVESLVKKQGDRILSTTEVMKL